MIRLIKWLVGLFAGPKNQNQKAPTQPHEPPKTKAGPPPPGPR